MKSLIFCMITLPCLAHANSTIISSYSQSALLGFDEDLTPPIYVPGDPIRQEVPIYDIFTREIITTVSSVYAYEIYVRMNGLAYFTHE